MEILLWLRLFFGRLVVSSVLTVGFFRTFGFRPILVGFFSSRSRETHLTTLWYSVAFVSQDQMLEGNILCFLFIEFDRQTYFSTSLLPFCSLKYTSRLQIAKNAALPATLNAKQFTVLNSVTFLFNPSCTKPFGTHTLYQGGGGGGQPLPPAISKTASPLNLKLCRVLEDLLTF